MTVINLFASPTLVFEQIRAGKTKAWWPLLTLLLASGVLFGWYFMSVDILRFMEVNMQLAGQTPKPEEVQQMASAADFIRIFSLISAVVMQLLAYLFTALMFFLLANLVTEDKLKYSQFLALVTWASLPTLLSLLSMALVMVTTNEFLMIQQLDQTTLSSLLSIALEHPQYRLFNALSIGFVWSIGLYALGFKTLTGSGWGGAIAIALVPAALVLSLSFLG